MTERVIIIGGGSGLELAKKLSDNKHSEVIVVDRNNYHFFPTLLYQVDPWGGQRAGFVVTGNQS